MKGKSVGVLKGAYTDNPQILRERNALVEAMKANHTDDILGISLIMTCQLTGCLQALSDAAQPYKEDEIEGEKELRQVARQIHQKLTDEHGLKHYHASWAINAWLQALDVQYCFRDFDYIVDVVTKVPVSECIYLAEKGDAYAAYELYLRYAEPSGGISQANEKEGVRWLMKAVAVGYAPAYASLGNEYYYGGTLEEDEAKAVECYMNAFLMGDMDSAFMIGRAYQNGQGVDVNLDYAVVFYEKGMYSDGRCAGALGYMHAMGQGVEKNNEMACELYQLGAKLNDDNCMKMLGIAYLHGYGVERDVSESFGWFSRAANEGNLFSINEVGVMYENGIGCTIDEKKALAFYLWMPR